MRALVGFLSLIALANAATAQTNLEDYLWESVDYLASDDRDPYAIDTRQQFAAILGREDLIPVERDFWLGQRVGGVCGESVGPPLETILDAAAETRLVIFNEDHMMALHRADTLGLIEALVDSGFTHFAYESFETSVMAPDRAAESFVRAGDVFYTNDPAGAALLRRLKAKGVRLVAYEGSDHPDGREAAQAEKLKSRVFDADPNARLIVLSGHAHVFEHVDGWAGQMMARRLKELTGLDPLTIAQDACRSATGDATLTRSLLKDDGSTAPIAETDFALGHPPLAFTANRPDWRRLSGGVDTPVPQAFLGRDAPVVVEARLETEPDVSVPSDRLLVLPDDEGIPLILPPGRYRITGRTRNGPVAEPVLVTVNPS